MRHPKIGNIDLGAAGIAGPTPDQIRKHGSGKQALVKIEMNGWFRDFAIFNPKLFLEDEDVRRTLMEQFEAELTNVITRGLAGEGARIMPFPIYKDSKIDWDAIREQDLRHAYNPRIGDYWQEMLVGIVVIVGRPSAEEVLVCREKIDHGDSWSWDLSKCKVEKVADFVRRLRCNKDDANSKFWCHCWPERMTWVEAEYMEFSQ